MDSHRFSWMEKDQPAFIAYSGNVVTSSDVILILFVVPFCFEIVVPTKSRVANLKILYSTARSREWGGGSRERKE